MKVYFTTMGLARLRRWNCFFAKTEACFHRPLVVVDENRYEHIIRLHYLFSFQLFSEEKELCSMGSVNLIEEKV